MPELRPLDLAPGPGVPTTRAPAPMLPSPWRVRRRRRETPDTVTLVLDPLGDAPVSFRPGQFNMLYPFGRGEVPISISGDPGDGDTLVHTVRGVGAVSRGLCELHPGDVLGVRGPYGSSWPVEESGGRDVLVVAGGIGLAPLRPAIYRLLARRERFGRITVLYGARSPEDLLYRKELESWRGRFDLRVEATVDHASAGWHGPVGVVTGLLELLEIEPEHTTAMICGPEIMMRFTLEELQRAGVSPEDIWVSLERNMHCGIGHCGHCQLGTCLVCRDGPVFPWWEVAHLLEVREL